MSSALSREGSASSSGFLATLLALELPREALDAVQRSGFVLPSSSRWFSETPPGVLTCHRESEDSRCCCAGNALRLLAIAGEWPSVERVPQRVRRSAVPGFTVHPERKRREPARLVPCTTDWPIQMIV